MNKTFIKLLNVSEHHVMLFDTLTGYEKLMYNVIFILELL